MINDPDANEESIYPKKLVYEPHMLQQTNDLQKMPLLVKKIDWSKYVRLVRSS